MSDKDYFFIMKLKWSMKKAVSSCLLCFVFLILGSTVAVFAKNVEYDPVSERDPFVSLVDSEGMLKMADQEVVYESNLVIEGIIYDPTGQSVIVSEGEVYREGEQVLGATVMKIFKDRVLLIENDEEKTVWLREEILS